MKLSIAALATLIALPVAAQMAPATPGPDARTELRATPAAKKDAVAKSEPKAASKAAKGAAKDKARTKTKKKPDKKAVKPVA